MNKTDRESFGDWTIPSPVPSTAEAESSSEQEDASSESLQISIISCNESIGFESGKDTTRVSVNVEACKMAHEDHRSPVDIIVALDTSSSMDGNKIKDCKRTLTNILRTLGPTDRMGLVCYGSDARIEIPARFLTQENKDFALQKIQMIRAHGRTNLSGGLCLAAQEMGLIDKPNPVRSIFLLTDGFANEGITDIDGLVSVTKSFNPVTLPFEGVKNMHLSVSNSYMNNCPELELVDKKLNMSNLNIDSPISLFCFGYGINHNSEMLQKISSTTPGGAYYFIQDDSHVSSAFGDAIGGILSVVAQSAILSLHVPTANRNMGIKILHIYHKEGILREDGSRTVTLGDFYAEESRDVLVDLQLSKDKPNECPVPHLIATISYMDARKKRMVKLDPALCSIARPANAEISPANMHVESQWLRLCTIRDLEAANKIAQRSKNMKSARHRLKASKKNILDSPVLQYDQNFSSALLTSVSTVEDSFQSVNDYESVGGHSTRNICSSLANQRSMQSNDDLANYYQSTKKAKYTKSFGLW